MMRYKTWIILTLILLAVLSPWYLDYNQLRLVNVNQLNVNVNEVEQILLYDENKLAQHLKKIESERNLHVSLLDEFGSFQVMVSSNRVQILKNIENKQLSNGLFTFLGVDYYIVPLSSGERLAFYGQSPSIRQLHYSKVSWGTLFLSIVTVLITSIWVIEQRQFSNFKQRLVYLLGVKTRNNLETANYESIYRFIITKFSEMGQELVDQRYSHELENTKQDERMRNMMHDMKTPIAALHAFVEAYEDGLYPPSQLPNKMPLVVRNVSHLIHLTDQYDNYLKYASWTTKSNMRRYSLDFIIQDVLMGIERDFASIGRTIQLVLMENPGSIVCDITELKKLLHILVENAHKYSDKDRTIVMSAMVRLGMLYISVKDYGIGIASDQHTLIFDPFVKVDKSRSASAKSYGIGLYIAKQIAIHHGGDITLESTPEKGATFTLVLPITET